MTQLQTADTAATPDRQCCGRCDSFSERLPSARKWGACRHSKHPETAQQHRDNGKNCCKFVAMAGLEPRPPATRFDPLRQHTGFCALHQPGVDYRTTVCTCAASMDPLLVV